MKNCSNAKCKQINPQPVDNFYRHKKGTLVARCKKCTNDISSNYQKANRKKVSDVRREWLKSNRSRVNENQKIWYQKNPGRMNFYSKKYYARDTGKIIARAITNKLRRSKRTPNWLTQDQKKKIELFYRVASQFRSWTKIPFEVDHIVPLCGKNVSGLHVPWNLQILTRTKNIQKSNHI